MYEGDANWFSYLVLGLWPFVVLLVFQQRQGRARMARTTSWLIMLGIMFMPASLFFDAPLIPPLDKVRITALTVRIALQIFHSKELLKRAPGFRMPQIIAVLTVIACYQTMATNRDPLQYGPLEVNAMSPSDFLSLGISMVLDTYLPFSIAQRVFTSERDLRDLFEVMARCLLIYLPFILYELRMAPVLHYKFYGYSPFSFVQALRADGYRPAVFMAHGLVLAMFAAAVYAGARGMWAAGVVTKPLKAKWLVMLFTVVLVMCKTFAALLYSGVVWLLIRRPLRTGAVAGFLWFVSIFVASYPALRIEGQFPTYMLVDWAAEASADRAQSLEFRFQNEDLLLAHGLARPIWGWGSWGRSRVYEEETGKDISVTDGLWVMWFGSVGHVGLALQLAMIILPLIRAARRLKKIRPSAAPMVAALAVISGCLAIDIIPNARADYLPVFLGGALWTLSETLSRAAPKKQPARPVPEPLPEVPPPETSAVEAHSG